MKSVLIIVALYFLLGSSVYGQVPHLTGTIEVSVSEGGLSADVKLSNIPTDSEYALRLNTGLNVEYFRDSKDTFNFSFNKTYHPEKSSETWLYKLQAQPDEKSVLPPQIRIKYTGKFPVQNDITKANDHGDWKGNIAFNGKTLRATEQSAWYPVLYDTVNDVVVDKYTFELTVRCVDCKALYLNGDKPVYAQQTKFNSATAVGLLLFAGNYNFQHVDGVYFLNTVLPQGMQTTLSNTIVRLVDYYQENLGIPYGNPVVFLADTPISRQDSWMFVTYPTIAFISPEKQSYLSLFDSQTFQFKNNRMLIYFAHEAAHYYAGTYFKPNSTLFWFWLEGVADYLSLKATKALLGEREYQQVLTHYITTISDFTPIPLNRIQAASEINESYRYVYAPLLLIAIEQELGKTQMWRWLQTVLQSNTKKTDFNFFKLSLLQSGVSQAQIDNIVLKYIDSPQAQKTVLESVKASIEDH